jgi:dienelactone hydrolase
MVRPGQLIGGSVLRGSGEYRIERWLVGGVAMVAVRPAGLSAPLPAVVAYHGLGGDKTDDLLRLAIPLADAGCLAVLPDAALHGERRPRDFHARLQHDRDGLFLEALERTVEEAPGVFSWVSGRDDVDESRIATVGTSMGGAIVLALVCGGLKTSPATAVALMPALPGPGSAVRQEAAYGGPDPTLCYPTPLLVVHGVEDHTVPYPTARDFYDALVPHYSDAPGRLRFIDMPGEEDRVGAYWLEETLAWLARYL